MLHDYERDRKRVGEGCDALVRSGVLEELERRDEASARIWLQCDLASIVENGVFTALDPRTLTGEDHARFGPRVVHSGFHLHLPDEEFSRAFWLLDGGERSGTLAVSQMVTGGGLVSLASLYVFPDRRGRGIAGRVLAAARNAFCDRGLRGLWVPTHWTWQPAVRYYLRLGMWVRNWKHSLVFIWTRDLPRWQFVEDGDRARFSVASRDGERVLIRACRRGERLWWRTEPALKEQDWEVQSGARGTFALLLAVRGWPLIRSARHWRHRWRWSDCGQVEGLAAKIELFEALDRERGFEVRTPRIPGIPYRARNVID